MKTSLKDKSTQGRPHQDSVQIKYTGTATSKTGKNTTSGQESSNPNERKGKSSRGRSNKQKTRWNPSQEDREQLRSTDNVAWGDYIKIEIREATCQQRQDEAELKQEGFINKTMEPSWARYLI